jgi:hypothetical protein
MNDDDDERHYVLIDQYHLKVFNNNQTGTKNYFRKILFVLFHSVV